MSETRGRDAASLLLVALTWAWVVVPRVTQSLTAPKHRNQVGIDDVVSSRLADYALLFLTLALLGTCLVIIVLSLQNTTNVALGALVVMLTPWFYLAMRDAFVGMHVNREALAYPLVVTAMCFVRPRRPAGVLLGYLVGISAVICLLMGFLTPSKGLLIDTSGAGFVVSDKQVLPFGILVGFLTNGNNLGQFLAMGIPFVGLIPRRGFRYSLLACSVFAIIWSASRSSIAALLFALLALLVLKIFRRESRHVVGALVAMVPWVVVVVLPFATHNPQEFTNRGFIWQVSLQWWHTNVWLGLGADFYQQIGQTSQRQASTVFHGHNQFVQLAVTGGLVLVALSAVLVFVAAVRAGFLASRGQNVGVVYLAALAGTCLLEKSFAYVDNTSMFACFVLPMAMILFGRLDEPEEEAVQAPVDRRYSVTT